MWILPSDDDDDDSEGVLTGAMKDLFVAGVSAYWDGVELELECSDDDEPWNPDGTPFERLPSPERLVVLARVAGGLLDRDVPAVDLTAVDDAAVAAIFDCIRDRVDEEIRSRQRGREFRVLAASAAREALPNRLDGYPRVTSTDREAWDDLLDALADTVLFDEDFAEDPLFQDLDPARAADVRRAAGIHEDYFAAAPPLASPAAIEAARAVLRRVCGRPAAHRI
ncbi:hypothetical protein [Aquisphaera insulae]|uniref:hypothetical protein n=1 Tax=Aquisphaera insulae TaxID=2712864 RepID=UPI0013EA59E6|nr:hypothetical protein [Aquisphaera insulae]